jgi:allantoate deiminase
MDTIGEKILDREVIASNVQKNLEALGQYTETPGNGTTRLPFTKEARAAAEAIKVMMQDAGLTVEEDVVGNVFGRLEGSDPALPVLMTGSHFDTVTSGGNFDGLMGIVTGIEIARLVRDSGVKLKRTLVVAAFNDEEGLRFGTGYFGSKAILGQLSLAALHRYKDKDGISIYDAMKEYGKNPEDIMKASWELKNIRAFIEAHIEQGPVLHYSGKELGLVECIVGIQRYMVTVKGRADHAGTTPMEMRLDAVEAASKVISKIPGWAREKGGGTVATVGLVKTIPGGMNIVAEEVQFSVDIRSRNNDDIEDIAQNIRRALDEACTRCGTVSVMDSKLAITPVNLNEAMLKTLEASCKKNDFSYRRMLSGAGHDALAIGQVLDTVMVFVPSKDGRSHCPVEWSEYHSIAKAVAVIYELIAELQ